MYQISSSQPRKVHNYRSGTLSDGEFLRSIAASIFALLIGGLLLTFCYVTFSPASTQTNADTAAADLTPLVIPGEELILRLGEGERQRHKGFIVNALGNEGHAVVTRMVNIDAHKFKFMQFTVTGAHPGEFPYLVWRTTDNPRQFNRSDLNWNRDKATYVNLSKNKEWRGTVTEIGLGISGDIRGQSLTIKELVLFPPSWQELLRTTWSEWTQFRGWTMKSINFQLGTPLNPLLPPASAMASWAGFSLLLLGIYQWIKKSFNVISIVAVIAIPWIGLDLLWQSELTTQLQDTKQLYEGKTQQEKHMAGWDKALYQYADHLKSSVLPEPGPRIFLLHDSRQETYTRLKMQYFLQPHNVYNYWRLPRIRKVRKEDYILVLGPIEGLEYNAEAGSLSWKNRSINVRMIDSTAQGKLFQVTSKAHKHG